MTTIVLLHNHFDQAKLDAVVEEMKVLGAPTIRCYDLGFDGLTQAIEGCHRLRACAILDIEPELVYLDPETRLEEVDGLDFDGDCSLQTIGELGDWENHRVAF